MSDAFRGVDRARAEVTASSAGGAPFLIAFGGTIFLSGIASFFVPTRIAALIVLFQGNLALPIAFWLERKMGSGAMAKDNPLRPLSIQLAMSQIVALPAVIVAYSLKPSTVPAVLAAIGGGHFLPYAWLQRSNIYVFLGVAVSVGALALTIALKSAAFPYVLFYMSAIYWVAAALVYRRARDLVRADAAGHMKSNPGG